MLRIALMGDLHYPIIASNSKKREMLQNAKTNFFKAYFDHFFEVAADLYLSIGDLTHNGNSEEFTEVYDLIQQYNKPFRQVLGNHDVLGISKHAIYTYTLAPHYDLISTPEASLILLDTTKEYELFSSGLDDAQWQWLDKNIESSSNKPLLVFAHHPVAGTTFDSPASDRQFEAYQDIRPLLKKREGEAVYFNGHTHSHAIVKQSNWHYVQTAAVLCDLSFRIIEIDQQTIHIKTVTLNDNLLEKNRAILYELLPDFHQPDHLNKIFTALELQYQL
ncbi:metallophosphoesterase family protein [Paenibacillus sp. IITD108]|uniref:metallophosphoesterase family protein n=1 Tax=Paenibacillus sp. IITD108 TaxID=3116649 RepID=UPI002F423AA5